MADESAPAGEYAPADESLRGPEPLSPSHEVRGFSCGSRALDDFLTQRALADQRARKSRTYVMAGGTRVLGFHSLAATSVERESATERARTGQGNHPVPAFLIARLAVDAAFQGRGLGETLLLDALRRCLSAAETIGARVVLVHAADERARSFYGRYGFEQSPTRSLDLMVLMKDVQASFDDR